MASLLRDCVKLGANPCASLGFDLAKRPPERSIPRLPTDSSTRMRAFQDVYDVYARLQAHSGGGEGRKGQLRGHELAQGFWRAISHDFGIWALHFQDQRWWRLFRLNDQQNPSMSLQFFRLNTNFFTILWPLRRSILWSVAFKFWVMKKESDLSHFGRLIWFKSKCDGVRPLKLSSLSVTAQGKKVFFSLSKKFDRP